MDNQNKNIDKSNLSFKDFLSGSVLTQKPLKKHLKLVFLIVFIAIVYINNQYKTESVLVEIKNLQEEVQELRNKSISYATELMSLSRESEVMKMVEEKELDIKELIMPPQKISIIKQEH